MKSSILKIALAVLVTSSGITAFADGPNRNHYRGGQGYGGPGYGYAGGPRHYNPYRGADYYRGSNLGAAHLYNYGPQFNRSYSSLRVPYGVPSTRSVIIGSAPGYSQFRSPYNSPYNYGQYRHPYGGYNRAPSNFGFSLYIGR